MYPYQEDHSFYVLLKKATLLCVYAFPVFVPFGIVNGDAVGPPTIDGVVGPLSLSDPIVFNLREHRSIYVSTIEYSTIERHSANSAVNCGVFSYSYNN